MHSKSKMDIYENCKMAIHRNNRSAVCVTFPFSLLLSDFSSTLQDVF